MKTTSTHAQRRILFVEFEKQKMGCTIQVLPASNPLCTSDNSTIPTHAGHRSRARADKEYAERSSAAVILGEAMD